jgi:hypothetical protein
MDIEQVLSHQIRSRSAATPNGVVHPSTANEFTVVAEGHYRLSIPLFGVTLDVDRLRREHHELVGELSVHCALPGARTVDGTLSIADFNLSSARARTDRAKLLAQRANTRDMDWTSWVEELCQRALKAERTGSPAVDLRTVAAPAADDDLHVDGLYLLRRHPAILFGDGGTAKSYMSLYVAGRLAEQGMRIAYFDWELAGEDHRDRLERLFWDGMPQIFYARCEKPLVYESDRLRRIVRENDVGFTVYDSIAFACDGPPESAEIAGRYFRAARQIGGGSLHIAHVSKAEGGDQKPFGSIFWHNGARATWYTKLAEASADDETLHLGVFNRKANLGRLRPPVGFHIEFDGPRTIFKREDVADNPDLAGQLTIRQRMMALLRKGAMAQDVIAEEIEADVETVKRTARRYKNLFILLQGGRLGLVERRA